MPGHTRLRGVDSGQDPWRDRRGVDRLSPKAPTPATTAPRRYPVWVVEQGPASA